MHDPGQGLCGVSTDSDAIRLALRVLAEAKEIALSPLPTAKNVRGHTRQDQENA
jgi:hypothetical protein